jgi:hypothetical protein
MSQTPPHLNFGKNPWCRYHWEKLLLFIAYKNSTTWTVCGKLSVRPLSLLSPDQKVLGFHRIPRFILFLSLSLNIAGLKVPER